MKKSIAYVDMDDTLCQFTSSVVEYRAKSPCIVIPWSTCDFFRKLKPIEGAIDGIKQLDKEFDVWILTRPSMHNPMSYMEKRLWVEDHLGFDWCKKLIICPDKTLMKPGLLIDDVNWQIKGFSGPQLLFGSSECPDWKTVIQLTCNLKTAGNVKNKEK